MTYYVLKIFKNISRLLKNSVSFEFENISSHNVLFIISNSNITVAKKPNPLFDNLNNFIPNRELSNYNIGMFSSSNIIKDTLKTNIFILQSGESYKIRFITDTMCMYALVESTILKNNWLIAENHIFDQAYSKFSFMDSHATNITELQYITIEDDCNDNKGVEDEKGIEDEKAIEDKVIEDKGIKKSIEDDKSVICNSIHRNISYV